MRLSVGIWAECLAHYRQLKPGSMAEIQEIGMILIYNDDRLKDDVAIYRGCMHLEESIGMIGYKLQDLNTIKNLLHDASFEGIVEHRYK